MGGWALRVAKLLSAHSARRRAALAQTAAGWPRTLTTSRFPRAASVAPSQWLGDQAHHKATLLL